MNGFEMIVTIVALISFSAIAIAFITRRSKSGSGADGRAVAEEMRAMKERLATLERLAVDREHSLAREIEGLRTPAPAASAARAVGVEVR